jgi:hypothetical protein
MTDDPLAALERELVDAARRLAAGGHRRSPRVGAIVSALLALGTLVLAVLSIVLAHH